MHAQTLQRSPEIDIWRERLPTVIIVAVGLLLAAGLFALIWTIIHHREPTRRKPAIIRLVLIPPPPTPQQRPLEPPRELVQRIPQAPPPKPIPPKKPIERPRDSVVQAPAPKPKPAPPQPKTRSAAVDNPMSLDAPPDWRQFALPQGANSGHVIGGDGDNGGGAGCGGASTILTIVTSQLRTAFTRNEKMDDRTFRIQAELWFDDFGKAQRSQLVQSTGKADLDASIRTRLGEISVGSPVPQCLQPITVWVSQPWEGTFAGKSTPAAPHMEVWQTRSRVRN